MAHNCICYHTSTHNASSHTAGGYDPCVRPLLEWKKAENDLVNVVCKMAAILSQSQCVAENISGREWYTEQYNLFVMAVAAFLTLNVRGLSYLGLTMSIS